jgi:hypothetical protein
MDIANPPALIAADPATLSQAAALLPRRARRRMERPARRLKLLALMGGWQGHCHWCGLPIAIWQDAAAEFEIVSAHGRVITYLTASGEKRSVFEATLDHQVPKREGGSDELTNLRAACVPCNSSRTPPLPPEKTYYAQLPFTPMELLAAELAGEGWHEGIPTWLNKAAAIDKDSVRYLHCTKCGQAEHATFAFYQPFPQRYRLYAECVRCRHVSER